MAQQGLLCSEVNQEHLPLRLEEIALHVTRCLTKTVLWAENPERYKKRSAFE